MPSESLIIGVDIVPIKAIPRAITLRADITTEKCCNLIRGALKTWDVDTVIHDGAPNVGTAWVQDAYSQAELVLQAIRLASKFLRAGGTFLTKIFRSKDYNALLWVLQQLFTAVEATKPPASRSISAEIYVVCTGFKAPKHMDARLLDSRFVFAELPGSARVDENRVMKPEIARRKRDGYADSDWTLHKTVPAVDFIACDDPIAMLGTHDRLIFGHEGTDNAAAVAVLGRLLETTGEVMACCEDLRVLGKKELRVLLRWRQKCQERMGFGPTKNSAGSQDERLQVATAIPNGHDEFLKASEELTQRALQHEKKRRRRDNFRTQREVFRMNMQMQTATDIGLDQADIGGGSKELRFSLLSGSNLRTAGRQTRARSADSSAGEDETEQDSASDKESEQLDVELDYLYEQYKSKKGQLTTTASLQRAWQTDPYVMSDFLSLQIFFLGGKLTICGRMYYGGAALQYEADPQRSRDLSPGQDRGTVQFFGQSAFNGIDGLQATSPGRDASQQNESSRLQADEVLPSMEPRSSLPPAPDWHGVQSVGAGTARARIPSSKSKASLIERTNSAHFQGVESLRNDDYVQSSSPASRPSLIVDLHRD